jgi:hypothetical protein
MDGWPVWLASLSIRDRNGNVAPTEKWSAERMDAAQASIDTLLSGLGDQEHERSFRMCVTLCRHRALTANEADELPNDWWTTPAEDLAGGPVEVLWSRGIPSRPSTEPCANPTKVPLAPGLFFPEDCGVCPSCAARKACRSRLPVRPGHPTHIDGDPHG